MLSSLVTDSLRPLTNNRHHYYFWRQLGLISVPIATSLTVQSDAEPLVYKARSKNENLNSIKTKICSKNVFFNFHKYTHVLTAWLRKYGKSIKKLTFSAPSRTQGEP